MNTITIWSQFLGDNPADKVQTESWDLDRREAYSYVDSKYGSDALNEARYLTSAPKDLLNAGQLAILQEYGSYNVPAITIGDIVSILNMHNSEKKYYMLKKGLWEPGDCKEELVDGVLVLSCTQHVEPEIISEVS